MAKKQIGEMTFDELKLWMEDPQNDCLRARGDKRWIDACTRYSELYPKPPNIQLFNDDALKISKDISYPSNVVVITDPPYGNGKYDTDVAVPMEYYRWLVETFKTVAIFGYPENLVEICIGLGRKPDEWITWNPTNKADGRGTKNTLPKETECIAIFGEIPNASEIMRPRSKNVNGVIGKIHTGRGNSLLLARLGDVWNDPAPGMMFNASKRRHPNEKPLSLMKKLAVLCSNEGDVIFDPFMGSGTTGEAAIPLGRGFAGIEKSLEFYEIAERVINGTKAQLSLRLPTPREPDKGDSPDLQALSTLGAGSALGDLS